MALRKCKECGKDISTKAKSCPNCGYIPKKKGSCLNYLVLIILVYLLVKLFSFSAKYGGSSSYRPPPEQKSSSSRRNSDDSGMAFVMSQRFVEQNLKAPATADFCSVLDAKVSNLGNNKYKVSAYVDSENSFGANIRTYYICVLKSNGDSWELESLDM